MFIWADQAVESEYKSGINPYSDNEYLNWY